MTEKPGREEDNPLDPEKLSGTWVNELGSTVDFVFNIAGVLCGFYRTKVGNAIVAEPLIGFYETSTPDHGRSGVLVAFSVAWRHVTEGNFPSVCTWSGRVHMKEDDSGKREVEMETIWVLSCIAEEPKDRWDMSSVNKNVFRKKPC